VEFGVQQVVQHLLLVPNDGSAFKPAEDYFCLLHPVGLHIHLQITQIPEFRGVNSVILGPTSKNNSSNIVGSIRR